MRKTLVALFTLVALAVGIQVTQAACPCTNPCPVVAPCQTPCAPACDVPCCPAAPVADCCPAAPTDPCACIKGPCKKCTWWKIFEDKCCCYKTNADCDNCFSAKRCHWYKFWTDRCVVKNVKCGTKCGCDDCCN